MTERHEAQQKYYMLILSLLIHLGILIALLRLTKTDQYILEKFPLFQEHTVEDQKQTPLPNNQLAALKSRASTFGAPIIFHEEPEVKAHSGDVHGNDTVEAEGDTYEPDTQVQQITAQEEPTVTQEQQEQPEPTDLHDEKSSVLVGALKKAKELKTEKASKIVEQSPEQEMKEEPDKMAKPPEQKEKQTEKSPKTQLQQKVVAPKKQIRKKTGQKRPGDSVRTATPAKKQLTLADLTEGFLNTLNRGGNDWLDRDGDPDKKPDFSDLKYMSYIRKVVWYMQNEWHATQSKLNINLHHDCILGVVITFAKDGSVQNVRVIQESGCPQLDEFLIRGIRRAGPYPSLPHHFNSDTFDLPLNIHNSAQSAQPWQMNLSSRPLRSR